MKILSEEDVRSALDPELLISSLEYAFGTLNDHRLHMPLRTHLELANGAVAHFMPCHDEAFGAGMKLVTVSNEAGVEATYLLLDRHTGAVLALMPANDLTDLRTAAISALATDQLARSDARVLGIFGTGRQARAHARVLPLVRQFEQILVCGSSDEKSRAFAQQISEYGVIAQAAEPEACVRMADVICTCTTSATPVLSGAWIRSGTHLNLVGAFRPETREVDTATVQRARVVVDTYAGALAEAGDLLIPIEEGAITREHITADLHQILSCRKDGRRSDEEITLFKSVGTALADLIAAQLVLATLESEAPEHGAQEL